MVPRIRDLPYVIVETEHGKMTRWAVPYTDKDNRGQVLYVAAMIDLDAQLPEVRALVLGDAQTQLNQSFKARGLSTDG